MSSPFPYPSPSKSPPVKRQNGKTDTGSSEDDDCEFLTVAELLNHIFENSKSKATIEFFVDVEYVFRSIRRYHYHQIPVTSADEFNHIFDAFVIHMANDNQPTNINTNNHITLASLKRFSGLIKKEIKICLDQIL